MMTTKSSHWAYENEYRLICEKNSDKHQSLPHGSITEIIFGCQVEDDNIEQLTKRIDNKLDCRVLKASKDKDNFRLQFETM